VLGLFPFEPPINVSGDRQIGPQCHRLLSGLMRRDLLVRFASARLSVSLAMLPEIMALVVAVAAVVVAAAAV
jgi:hypothetical protein